MTPLCLAPCKCCENHAATIGELRALQRAMRVVVEDLELLRERTARRLVEVGAPHEVSRKTLLEFCFSPPVLESEEKS